MVSIHDGARPLPVVSAIVLAAGGAARMGRQKLLLPIGGQPMLRRVVGAALGSRATEVIVVVGSEAAAVVDSLRDLNVMIVENFDYLLGMSTSVHIGLAAVRPDSEAAIFLLGDQPFVTPAVVDSLIARFADTGAPVVRPVVNGRQAHPVLISAALFPQIRRVEGDLGAREVVRKYADCLELVTIDEPRVAMDIDTHEDYIRAERTDA